MSEAGKGKGAAGNESPARPGLRKRLKSVRSRLLRFWKPSLAVVFVLIVAAGLFAFKDRGHGLLGEYHADRKTRKRVDPRIDFDWKKDSPFRSWKKDNFSVRWTGFLKAPEAGDYEVSVRNDDGVRLWIDRVLIIDDWNAHVAKVNNVAVRLQKGYHTIRIHYFERRESAVMQLFWKTPSDGRFAIIPAANLLPNAERLEPGESVFGIAELSKAEPAPVADEPDQETADDEP